MKLKRANAFNGRAKETHLFCISLACRGANDCSAKIEEMMLTIQDLAGEKGLTKLVSTKSGGCSLDKTGVFYMNAPEAFALTVKKQDGVISVVKAVNAPVKQAFKKSSTRKKKSSSDHKPSTK